MDDIDDFGEIFNADGKPRQMISAGFVIIHEQVESSNRRVSDVSKELSAPKRLAGPSNDDAIDYAISEVFEMSQWLRDPISQIWKDAKSRIACGRGFGFRPLLLVGDHGCGKTQLASLVSSIANVPSVRLDVSGMTAGFDISGTDQQWKDSTPGAHIQLISSSGVANPIVIVDEIDKFSIAGNGGDPRLALLPLLQRDTAATYRCPFLRSEVDLSYVSWMLVANSLDRLPMPLLDRVTIHRVGYPAGKDLLKFIDRVFCGLELNNSDKEQIIKLVERGQMSLRGVIKLSDALREFDSRPLYN